MARGFLEPSVGALYSRTCTAVARLFCVIKSLPAQPLELASCASFPYLFRACSANLFPSRLNRSRSVGDHAWLPTRGRALPCLHTLHRLSSLPSFPSTTADAMQTVATRCKTSWNARSRRPKDAINRVVVMPLHQKRPHLMARPVPAWSALRPVPTTGTESEGGNGCEECETTYKKHVKRLSSCSLPIILSLSQLLDSLCSSSSSSPPCSAFCPVPQLRAITEASSSTPTRTYPT